MSSESEDDNNLTAPEQLQAAAAGVLCDIKHACKTTQKTVDQVVSGINGLTDKYLDFVKDTLHSECLRWDGSISLQQINTALDSLKGQSVFEGIESSSRLDSYLQEKSGGENVLLIQIVLALKRVFRKGLPYQVPSKFGYSVRFLPQLEQLLNCKDVMYCVENPLPARQGVFQTITDGLFYKFHPVVLKHGPQTLCFTIHVDDVEVCDPLKSRANKHSLRMFYWVLGNIHPKKRSRLRAVNLLAIVKSKVAKEFGNHHFLKDFVDAMKILGSEGAELIINGVPRRFYGALLFCAADNPAAANLGGFKETHTALRPCRVCMVLTDSLNESFAQSPNLLRRIAEHEEHLRQVLSPKVPKDKPVDPKVIEEEEEDLILEEVSQEKYLDHKNPSVNFGVNSGSILSECPGFDVTKCFPQDVMHLLAEGMVELLCRLVLRDLCIPAKQQEGQKKRNKAPMCLNEINKAIETKCDLGHLTSSKPSRIEPGHLTGSKLKQSAAQMMVLLHLLPFLIYQVCPAEKMELVRKLIILVDLCMSFESSLSDVAKLELMIEDYGNSFKKVYPNVRSLKLHCSTHLIMQIRLFGPLRQQGCYRFEQMHSEFTRIADVVRSKKNVAVSCAMRHLSSRNNSFREARVSGQYLYDGDQVKCPTPVVIDDLPEKQCLLEKFYQLKVNSVVFQVKQVLKDGHVWEKGVVILLEKNDNNSVFGRIHNVFVKEENYIFVYNEYVSEFVPTLNAFKIKKCEKQMRATSLSELMHPHPILRFSFNLRNETVAYLLIRSPGGNV